MRLRIAVLAGLLLASGASAQPIDSREGIALQNQILELRQQLQQLAQQRGGGPAPVYRAPPPTAGGSESGLVAQLLDRVSTLEDQVRSLRGQVEDVTNQQQRQQQDFTKQLGDLQFSLQNGGGAAAAPASRQPPAQTPAAQPSSLGVIPAAPAQSPAQPPRTPELAMQEASAALARRDYPAAEAAAREVIAKRGPQAPNAQFLMAMAEMGERKYQQAAPDFYDAYNRSRTGPRAQDSLLGVADALVALGDKQSACDALAKLRGEFPQMRPEVREAASSTRVRAGCR